MYFNLKKVYPELQLGIYYHCADNIHYYERHFELVDKILDSKLDNSIKMELKYPMFIFDNGNLQITNEFIEFKNRVIEIINKGNISKEQVYWKEILSQIINFS